MNWQENKLKWTLTMGLGLVFASLFFGFKSMQQRNFEADEITYEMVRPDSFTPNEYDLSGRRIERKVLNPFEKVIAAIKSLVKKDDKKAVAEKAKNTAPKAAAKTDKKKDSKKVAARPKFQMNVVGRDQKNNLQTAFANNPYRKVQTLNPTTPAAAANAQAVNTDNVKEAAVTGQQLKDQLLQEPSVANMQKLLSAVASQQVSMSEFYSITKTLLDNRENPAAQNIGLFGLQSYPQAQSFTLIAQSYDGYSDQGKAYADQIMMSYNQPQRIAILAEVLKSNNEDVVLHAGSVITQALQKIDNKETSYLSSGRGGQRGQSLPTTVEPYLNLVPVLEQLTANPNENTQELLTTILDQIEKLSQST